MEKVFSWNVLELEFQSLENYLNPYLDVEVKACFTQKEGMSYDTYCFWDGDNIWRARFAPPHAGKWYWKSSCSNQNDKGLDSISGEFIVEEYKQENPIYKHGFLKVNDNGRGFEHQDNTPFFWLGDTVWSCPSRVALDEWKEYISYRSKQGYNVAQINFLPQHDASGTDYRIPFEPGEIVWDIKRINVDYFKALDPIMEAAVGSGMITAGVVLWFDYVPGTNPTWGVFRKADFTPELATAYARYLAARYAAYGTVWIVTGDTDYESSYAESVYDAAAEAIKGALPYPGLLTAHLYGGIFTPQSLNKKTWLDFHMYQASHSPESYLYTTVYASGDREYEPARPVLNAEPPYENIGFFKSKEQISRDYVRKVAWISVIGGANAGITYGAHGLWSWHRQGEEFKCAQDWHMPYDWREALRFEGADDYVRLKGFMERLEWWKLVPQNGLLKPLDGQDLLVCAAIDDMLVAYIYRPVELILDTEQYESVDLQWFNPKDGTAVVCKIKNDEGRFIIEKSPFTDDSVLWGVFR